MRRTMHRPLPAGRLSAPAALIFGLLTVVLGEAYLALVVNPLTAWLGLAALVSYVLMYTPLKQRTTLCTAIGAFPGALPPLLQPVCVGPLASEPGFSHRRDPG